MLERDAGLTEGELIAVLVSHYSYGEQAASILAHYSSAEDLMRTLTPASYRKQSACRLLAAVELARRHRARAGFDRSALEPGSLGLSSPYLVKLLDPESPLDRPTRLKQLANVRSNSRMAEDFKQLDRLADDAGTDDVFLAIRHHAMFEALCEKPDWEDPAEVVGDPVPFSALLAIAEIRIARSAESPARLMMVRELLEAADLEAVDQLADVDRVPGQSRIRQKAQGADLVHDLRVVTLPERSLVREEEPAGQLVPRLAAVELAMHAL